MSRDERDNQVTPHDPHDAAVEVMLGEHFNSRLGGQVGKASAAFAREMDRELHAREVKRTRRAWFLAAIPTAVAACVVVLATISYMKPGVVDAGKGSGGGTVVADSPKVDSTTYYRDFDGGVRVVSDENGTRPVRQIRRQVVQETEWYDPVEKATMRVTVPAEQTVYVGVQPY
jgi:hypothetical protein